MIFVFFRFCGRCGTVMQVHFVFVRTVFGMYLRNNNLWSLLLFFVRIRYVQLKR